MPRIERVDRLARIKKGTEMFLGMTPFEFLIVSLGTSLLVIAFVRVIFY